MAKVTKEESASEYWREQVRLSEAFDGTAAEFCRQNNINSTSFYIWRKKLKDRVTRGAMVKSPFIAVEVIPDPRRFLPDPKWVADLIRHLAVHA